MSQNEKENSIIELALQLGKHVEQSHQNFANIATAINAMGDKLNALEERLDALIGEPIEE